MGKSLWRIHWHGGASALRRQAHTALGLPSFAAIEQLKVSAAGAPPGARQSVFKHLGSMIRLGLTAAGMAEAKPRKTRSAGHEIRVPEAF
jgi:hypothetical protein